MKNYGIITEYDGIVGSIKGIDSIDYKFFNNDLLQKDIIWEENSHVEFEPQIIEKLDFTFYRANYVKILKKTSEIKQQK